VPVSSFQVAEIVALAEVIDIIVTPVGVPQYSQVALRSVTCPVPVTSFQVAHIIALAEVFGIM
jgi:hypothetical protein